MIVFEHDVSVQCNRCETLYPVRARFGILAKPMQPALVTEHFYAELRKWGWTVEDLGLGWRAYCGKCSQP